MPGPLMTVLDAGAYALAQFSVLAATPTELLVGVTVLAAVFFAATLAVRLVAAVVTPPGTGVRQLSLRARARRRRLPRQLDPDGAGRPRPRAPGADSSAA